MEPPDELVAAVLADPTDRDAIAVYADWLQGQGDPCGELIVARQHDKPFDDTRAGLTAGYATYGWRAGLWQWLRLQNALEVADDAFDPVATYRATFASPLALALDELRIGILHWDRNHELVPAVIAEAGRYPWAAHVRRCKLGDVDRDVDLAMHCIGDVGAALSASFPALEWLCLHSGTQGLTDPAAFGFHHLDLPALDTLVIETCAMTIERVAQLATCRLPSLTALDLWFGSTERDSDAALADLSSLLAGRWFPTVTRLGLKNNEFTDDLCAALAASPIAPRLVELDLGLGTLGYAGVAALVESRGAYRALRTLDVSDNFLRAADERALRDAFDGVTVISNDQKIAEGDYRYVSVGE